MALCCSTARGVLAMFLLHIAGGEAGIWQRECDRRRLRVDQRPAGAKFLGCWSCISFVVTS